MKTHIVIIVLLGAALSHASPTTKSAKSKSELKDWIDEKKHLTKSDHEAIDDIKQGNRTKKSVVCLEITPPENEDCPPGCGEHGHAFPQGPSQVMIPSVPQAPMMIPSGPPSYMMPSVPQAPMMIPSGPPASYMIPSAPQRPMMIPSGPPPPMMIPSAPQAPMMIPSGPPASYMIPSAPQRPMMIPSGPPPPMMIPSAPQAPMMIPSGPPPSMVLPPPPPPPPLPPLIMPRPPQIVGPIPHLPPCPPEEQYLIPGKDSEEVISYEMVPVSHHVPSRPSQLVTTPRPPYPCIPAGQAQLPQLPSPSLTTVQQQSTVNQMQVVQGNSYAGGAGSNQYQHPSGNVHMIQLPSNSGSRYPSVNPQPQHAVVPSHYQPSGYQMPTMIVSPHTDCAPAAPTHMGAYGFQASQSAAQSYAASQSAAYSGYGMSAYRSAQDPDDEVPVYPSIPQVGQSENFIPGYPAPSSRYSSYGRSANEEPKVVVLGGSANSQGQGVPQGGMTVNGQISRGFAKRDTDEKEE